MILTNNRRVLVQQFIIFLSFFFPLTLSAQNNSYSMKVYFDSDKFCLSENEQKRLDDFMSSMDSLIIKRVSIFGYCDDLESTSYNDTLSKKRASHLEKTIKSFIGNDDIVFHYEGRGELLIDDSINEKHNIQRDHNRRVDMVFETSKNLKGKVVVLENVNFVGGTTQLLSGGYPALNKFLTTLKENEHLKVIILGHVAKGFIDDGHDDGYDKATGKYNLSEARAKFIYDYLIKNGISEDRLSYKGLGYAFPTGKGAYYDRRVEVKIL